MKMLFAQAVSSITLTITYFLNFAFLFIGLRGARYIRIVNSDELFESEQLAFLLF